MSWDNRYENEKIASFGQAAQHLIGLGLDGLGDAAKAGLDAVRDLAEGMTHPLRTEWAKGTSWQQALDTAAQHPGADYQPTLDRYMNQNSSDVEGAFGYVADTAALLGAGLGIHKLKGYLGIEPGGPKGVAKAVTHHTINKLVGKEGPGYDKLREFYMRQEIGKKRVKEEQRLREQER